MSERPPETMSIEPPRQYQGVFAKMSRRYLPLLEDARASLAAFPVPDIIRDHYRSIVDGHAQPSFVLFPLMFLDLADATSGLTSRHREYLPWQMLAMELVALYDDTVDYTPQRSGAPTYAWRHGAAPAAVLSGFIYSTLADRTASLVPEISPLLNRMFETLCAHELWEHESRYPEISDASFARWIRRRYDAIPPVLSFALDGALLLHRLGPIPEPAHRLFGDLQQDVDDLVNILEEREKHGENDDLKMGIPSYPLLATMRAAPAARRLLEALWEPYRAIPQAARHVHHDAIARHEEATAGVHRELVELVREHGVRATIDKIIAEAEAAVAETPEHARPRLREYYFSVVDRLRDLDPRARLELHVPRAAHAPVQLRAGDRESASTSSAREPMPSFS